MDNCKQFAKFGADLSSPITGIYGNAFQLVRKPSREAEKIFPFTGQNRRTTIRVEPKTYDERRKVERWDLLRRGSGRHLTVRIFLFQFRYFLAKDSFLVNDVKIIRTD
jgi:hypothetical protein